MSRTRCLSSIPASEAFRPFFMVPKAIYKRHLLKYATPAETLVFFALLHFRWGDTMEAFVGVEKLAQTTHLNPSTVMKATKGLAEIGLIAKRGRTDERELRYELLPYGSDPPPNSAEIVIRRTRRARRKPSHDASGHFRWQSDESPGPTSSAASRACPQGETDTSSGNGHPNSSETGVQNSSTSGHHREVLQKQ